MCKVGNLCTDGEYYEYEECELKCSECELYIKYTEA